MPYSPTIREEELKLKVARDIFGALDCTRILGAVDFCVSVRADGPQLWEPESLLWAEAKAGVREDLAPLFAQLVLTLGKARTFDDHLPPPFLGAFDAEKIAFLPYHEVVDLFYQNDFNWNVPPSDASTREFRLLLDRVRPLLAQGMRVFRFDGDAADLAAFVRRHLVAGRDASAASLNVTRNNFVFVYQKWARDVKPSIAVDWDGAKRHGILDADFFLADLLSKDGATLVEKLYVVLRGSHYELDRRIDSFGFIDAKRAEFKDGQAAHRLFWNRYRRPPKKEYWGYISERRDLLVPQDVRERKGSYFTPQIWVEKAQEALAAALGENWQDEYDVWDCAAGTGNLLAGLQDKYRVWASTLDRADVEVMRERIKNGANLLDSHVFQFDFLNGSFDDLPDNLRAIVQDPERRKKLVVFINPPYAEAGNKGQMTARGKNKSGVTSETEIYTRYHDRLGTAARELAALFLTRIYCEIPGCVIANFTKLKIIQSVNFKGFRNLFQPKLESLFVVPAKTFDNVKGEFPIGFFVWRGDKQERFSEITAEVFQPSRQGCEFAGRKTFCSYDSAKFMLHWIRQFFDKSGDLIAYLRVNGQDMQNRNGVFLTLSLTPNDIDNHFYFRITAENVVPMAVYFAVRHCIEADWLNDRDQFLWPADTWAEDVDFQFDCLVYTLFHGQNRISCRGAGGGAPGGRALPAEGFNAETQRRGEGFGTAVSAPLRLCVNKSGAAEPPVNHWIPFSESEVDAKDRYRSHFMAEFLRRAMGVLNAETQSRGESSGSTRNTPPCPSGASPLSEGGVPLVSPPSGRGVARSAGGSTPCSAPASAPLRLCVESTAAPMQGLLFDGGSPGFGKERGGRRNPEAEYHASREIGLGAESEEGKSLRPVPTSDAQQAPLPLCLAEAPRLKSLAGEPPAPPEPIAAEAGVAYDAAARDAVLAAGRALWRYYHSLPGALPDASFYDIRAHFQGFNPSNGHMNADSPDAEYTRLLADLRAAMRALAAQIAPKVRQHGFLR